MTARIALYRSGPRRVLTHHLSGVVVLVAVVVVWQLAVGSGLLVSDNVPAPGAVASAFGGLLSSGQLVSDCGRTLEASLIGWVAGAIAGMILGLAVGLSRVAHRLSYASLVAIRTIPPVGFVPLLLLLLGYSIVTEIAIAAFATACTMAVYALAGARSVSETHREMSAVLHMGTLARVRKVDLPSAMPSTFVGLRVSLALSLALTVVSEMFATSAGIGYGLIHAQQAARLPDLYAYIVLTGVLSLLLNAVLMLAVRVLAPGFTQYTGEDQK